MPDISYIVSLYHRTALLRCCLASLAAQKHQDFEVIVTDNTMDTEVVAENRAVVKSFGKQFRHLHTGPKVKVPDCYWSSELGMKEAEGRFLCFPCEDNYYPDEWASRMLAAAARGALDLVLCGANMTGPEPCGADRYFFMEMGSPTRPGYKPSFIVRRDKFSGWLNKPTMAACSGVDRTTLEHMVKNPDIRWGVVRDLYYAHN